MKNPKDEQWCIVTSGITNMAAIVDEKNPEKICPAFGGASSLTNYSNIRQVSKEEAKAHLKEELKAVKEIKNSPETKLEDKTTATTIYEEMQRFYNFHFGVGIYMTPEELSLAEKECPGYIKNRLNQ
jgi:hypothetical protein